MLDPKDIADAADAAAREIVRVAIAIVVAVIVASLFFGGPRA